MSSIFKENKKILYVTIFIVLTAIIGIIISIHLFTPNFKIKSFEKRIELNYGEEFKEQYGEVCYGNLVNCKNVEVQIDGQIDSTKLATYKIKYTYKHNKKAISKTQIVSIVDKEAPELTIETSGLNICPNGNFNSISFKAIDNVDGDISNKVKTEIKDNMLFVSVTDSSGNESKEEVKVLVEDTSAPTLKLKGDSIVYVKQGSSYKDPGVKVYDNCDSDIKVKTNNQVDYNKVGKYKITYEAIDSSNNKSKIERTIIVYKQNTTSNSIPSGNKIVYLTFDDGPSQYTDQLLNILNKYNVKVTFFVTGYGNDKTILREHNEGHTVALHSNSHDYSYIYKNIDNYFKDLETIQSRVKRIIGEDVFLIRFPGGSSNTVSRRYDGGTHIMSVLSNEVTEKGYHYFDWNVTSGDAGETTSTERVYQNVINGMKSHNVSVVLQHDTKKFSIDAVERIIQFGLENGYTFKTLDAEAYEAHHPINN